MKITHITRKISGNNYDNMSATAELSDGDDPVKCAIALDEKVHEMLCKITENGVKRSEREEKSREIKYKLERLLFRINNGEDVGDIPF